MRNEIPQIETKRLILVPMHSGFANPAYLSWLNDPEVNKYLEVKKENTMNELIAYVEDMVKARIHFWGIVIRENNKHIGNIKIDPINTKHLYAEYGIMMGDKEEWGKGYAKEASKAIVDFCFESLKLRKVNLGVVKENEAAVNLYKKLGFIVEGEFKKHVLVENKPKDIIRMAIFNPESGD